MVQRGNGYTDTGLCKYYVSSDKINWTEIGVFSMEEIADVQLFGIKSSKGRYIKIRIESSYRYGYCSLSEVYVYGLEYKISNNTRTVRSEVCYSTFNCLR